MAISAQSSAAHLDAATCLSKPHRKLCVGDKTVECAPIIFEHIAAATRDTKGNILSEETATGSNPTLKHGESVWVRLKTVYLYLGELLECRQGSVPYISPNIKESIYGVAPDVG